MVGGVRCPFWPSVAAGWITRERMHGWPPKSLIDQIVRAGCHVVPKAHWSHPESEDEWRFSFSLAELSLIHSWNQVQVDVYHILRRIKEKVVRRSGGERRAFLCTYHFKVLMLWACERNSPAFWSENHTEGLVKYLLCVMIGWLIDKKCPNYFIGGHNLFEQLLRSGAEIEQEIESLLNCAESLNNELWSHPVSKRETEEDGRNNSSYCVRVNRNILMIAQTILDNFNVSNLPNALKPGETRHRNTMAVNGLLASELQHVYEAILIHRRLNSAANIQLDIRLRDVERAKECFSASTLAEKEELLYTDGLLPYADDIMELISSYTCSNKDSIIDRNSEKPASEPRNMRNTCTGKCLGYFPSNSLIDGTNRFKPIPTSRSTSPELESGEYGCTCREYIQHIELFTDAMSDRFLAPPFYVREAHEANFYYTALLDYRKATEVCVNVFRHVNRVTHLNEGLHMCRESNIVSEEFLSVVVTSEWSGIFDTFIQRLFGFITLWNSVKPVPDKKSLRDGVFIVQLNPYAFLQYIYKQCARGKNTCTYPFATADGRHDRFLNAALKISRK